MSLIKDKFKFIVIIEFVFSFWTFNIFVEIGVGLLMMLILSLITADTKEEFLSIRKFYKLVTITFGVAVIFLVVNNIVKNPNDFFSIETLKEFILPIFLLIVLLPVFYGLAVYNLYENIFLKLRIDILEKKKMKKSVIKYCNINLNKLDIVYKFIMKNGQRDLEQFFYNQ
ncbi:hypothetical protein [Miniphocaeibacter massiliensis]|uniref:hypothetical protein n=1 Tax=Miniphocaeibacter massiliensis TaxID=2041841 RepID=UPI000C083CB2|nr:hypothetical protein [Miniphocaeibacter massiliensis]